MTQPDTVTIPRAEYSDLFRAATDRCHTCGSDDDPKHEMYAPPGEPESLRDVVFAYLDHMDKREPYANVHADIMQAGSGGPDFTVNRHFDGDGCFAELERAVRTPVGAEERLRSVLRDAVHAKQRFTGTDVTLDAATFDALLEAAADVVEARPSPRPPRSQYRGSTTLGHAPSKKRGIG